MQLTMTSNLQYRINVGKKFANDPYVSESEPEQHQTAQFVHSPRSMYVPYSDIVVIIPEGQGHFLKKHAHMLYHSKH